MNKIPVLVRRELSAFFVSPMAYIVLTVFLAITGLWFVNTTLFPDSGRFAYGGVVSTLNAMSIMLLFLLPLLTMRLLSEEISSGTMETLMTAPVSNLAVVFSKFLGTLAFLAVMLLPTIAFPVMLYLMAGDPKPDTGPVVSGYFGLLLLGMTTAAAGVCVSGCVRNQISAAVMTALVLALLWFAGSATAGKATAAWERTIQYLGILYHFESFAKGLIDTRDVVFYVTATALFLLGAVGILAVRRWR